MKQTPPAKPNQLRADDPIHVAAEDRLGRGRLVALLANHIRAVEARESLVIGLNAPWGAGKTSFLNLLHARLLPAAAPGSEDPIVVRFNPWLFTNLEQLTSAFFDELSRAIGTADRKKLSKQIGTLLHVTGTLLAPVNAGLGALAASAGKGLQREASLHDTKTELDRLLARLNRRIVVFVDDLDRLEHDMLATMLKMIRLVADFPGTTYVLAFDRAIVESNMDQSHGLRGRSYLEKIVQVSFDLPAPDPHEIHALLFAELNELLEIVPAGQFDSHRWGNLFHSGFKEHFRTIRSVKRYVNSLRVTLPAVAGELDVVDLFGMELLRVFHPTLYWRLPQEKDLLAPSRWGSPDLVSQDAARKRAEDICGTADAQAEDARRVLQQLFPDFMRRQGTTGADAAKARREGRVCEPDVFDKFYFLGAPSRALSEDWLRRFVDALSGGVDSSASTMLSAALADEKGLQFVARIQDYIGELPAPAARALARLVMARGDELRFDANGSFDFDAERGVPRIAVQSLRRLSSERERSAEIMAALGGGAPLFTAVEVVQWAQPDPNERHQLFTEPGLFDEIKVAAVARLEAGASDGTLWSSRGLLQLLYAWRRWSSLEEVAEAVRAHVVEDGAFVRLVAGLATSVRTHGQGDLVSRKVEGLHRPALNDFLGSEEAARLRLVAISGRAGELASLAAPLAAVLGRPAASWER